jgi:hypothetical protein
MPKLSRWMIRSSFINLWAGFGIATLILSQRGLPDIFPIYAWQWIPVHVNLLLIGWMVQFAFGVSYWIFPRLFDRRTDRGRPKFAVMSAIMLNLGVWLHAIAGLTAPWYDRLMPLRPIGLGLQILSAIIFAYHGYPRARPTFMDQGKQSDGQRKKASR